MKKQRLLIATDVPFWRKGTGAQQRIASIVAYLNSVAIEVQTFFLGQTGTPQFTTADQQAIRTQQLAVVQRSSEQIPHGLRHRFGWYADATLNQIRQWRHAGEQATAPAAKSAHATDSSTAPLRPRDFIWPWAARAFREAVDQFEPDAVLIEYVTLTYLLEAMSYQQRNRIRCLLDTHDVLHLRRDRFRERGFKHWLDISESEEAELLQRFDTVIAIQEAEAELFRKMAPGSNVITCGHLPDLAELGQSQTFDRCAHKTADRYRLNVGYLGSSNASNENAILGFLASVWLPLQTTADADRLRLVIGGSITDQVKTWLTAQAADEQERLAASVTLLGQVGQLADFYQAIDVAINPVEFGTGLKIKNCEAIAFGCPLLTTEHGVIGLPETMRAAVKVCHNLAEITKQLRHWLHDRAALLADLEIATQLSQNAISQRQAYSALKQAILQPK